MLIMESFQEQKRIVVFIASTGLILAYGAWGNIPAMPCDYEPNKDEIFEWVKKHNNGELFSAWGFNKK